MNTVFDSTVSDAAVARIAALAMNPISESLSKRIQITLDDYRNYRLLLVQESPDDTLLRPYGGSVDVFVNTIDNEGLTNHLRMLAEVTLNDPKGGSIQNMLTRKVGELQNASQWPDVHFTATQDLLKVVVMTVMKMNPAFSVPKRRRPISMPPHLMTVLLTTNVGRKDYATDTLLYSLARVYALRAGEIGSFNPFFSITDVKRLTGGRMSVAVAFHAEKDAKREDVKLKTFRGRTTWHKEWASDDVFLLHRALQKVVGFGVVEMMEDGKDCTFVEHARKMLQDDVEEVVAYGFPIPHQVFLESLNLPLPVIVALKTKLYGPGMREVLALSR
ncbi:hypothetical protein TrRE_jg12378, partial [Triparma retinervis]